MFLAEVPERMEQLFLRQGKGSVSGNRGYVLLRINKISWGAQWSLGADLGKVLEDEGQMDLALERSQGWVGGGVMKLGGWCLLRSSLSGSLESVNRLG